MPNKDISIVCVCGKQFYWTEGEQDFLQKLIDAGKSNRDGSAISFTHPKRCIDCRAAKKKMYATRDERERRGQ